MSKFKYPIWVAILSILSLLTACASTEKTTKVEEFVYPAAPDTPRYYWEKMLLGSMSVEHDTEDNRIQRFITGTTAVNKGFIKPFGVSVHKGRIFVSDPPARDVLMFDPKMYKFKSLASDPNVTMIKPFGLENDAEGNLYVLDQVLKDIKIFNRDGEIQRTLKLDVDLIMPTDLAVTPDGSSLFVSQTGGVSEDLHVIYKFDTQSGALLQTIGKRGRGDVEFNLPKGITLDEQGLLYVVDSGNFRVQVIDPATSTLIRKFGQVGRDYGSFSRPKDIAVDKEGKIYVSDAAFGNFMIFNPEGKLLLFVGKRGGQLKPGNFMLNSGIAVDEDGRVLMADQFFQKVDIFRPVTITEESGYLGVPRSITDEEYLKIKEVQQD